MRIGQPNHSLQTARVRTVRADLNVGLAKKLTRVNRRERRCALLPRPMLGPPRWICRFGCRRQAHTLTLIAAECNLRVPVDPERCSSRAMLSVFSHSHQMYTFSRNQTSSPLFRLVNIPYKGWTVLHISRFDSSQDVPARSHMNGEGWCSEVTQHKAVCRSIYYHT